ncbi:S-layer homology domain-containing protein [cf. Phormidesmis sp. LEGE 11477]|uniref:S-layer homology domain-containing protein n=1 Tax=cf. Phormidesmis sp. LEGE 11477 TaxID=1828680 RepID=UPI00187F09C5|nr:S-layer homology domain-containing protein [cf. Phormidesmis sp. LEGE 11477]
MTQSSPQPPNDPRRPEEPVPTSVPTPPNTGANSPIGFDEMVALFVAFLSLGGVLVWGLTRGNLSIFSDSDLPIAPVVIAPDVEDDELIEPGIIGRGTDADIAPDTLTDDVDFSDMSAQEELAARAAIRRERLLAQQQSSPLADVARAGAVGAAAGTVAAPDSVAAEEVEEVERPVAASEAASAEPQEAIAFADVPDGYWAEPYIDALSSRGLISGYDDGTFRPDQPVTRAQTANIVSRTFDLTADKASLEFSDVESEYWARESIGEVVRGGFMTGFPDDTFKPNLPVTRAQALTTLVTGLGIESPQNIQATLSRYTDASAIPQWANDKIAAATAGSLVVNYPDASQLNPAEPTTRAELSALIYQALVREGVVEPVESEYVVEP